MIPHGRFRGPSGQALTEFAVIAPLLLLILMATVGFGHLMYSRMVVLQAANRAARLGAVLYGDSQVPRGEALRRTREAALAVLGAAPAGETEVQVETVGDDIRVSVHHITPVPVPMLGRWLGQAVTNRHVAVYRIERDAP